MSLATEVETGNHHQLVTEEFLTTLAGLWAGTIPPRIGDFVKSGLVPNCVGFIESEGVLPHTHLKIYQVRLASGTVESIGAEDVIFLAPFEWGLQRAGDNGDNKAEITGHD